MMCGGDEDRAAGVPPLANEEPPMVVKTRIDIVWEVVREDCGDSRGGVVWKRETPLRRGGCGSIRKRVFSTENRDVGCDWGGGGHRGSEVFALGGDDEDVVGVDGDILVKWGEEEGIEDFLSYLGGSGRHC